MTDRQTRLFAWLFGQPARSFHLSELRRLTGLGSASVQSELNRLTDAGLLVSERVGNLRSFKANADSPIFDELVSLTRKTLGLVPALGDALAPLSPRLQAACVFGSVASHTDTAQSDVDVMLVGKDITLGEVLEQLAPLEQQWGRKINPSMYSPQEFLKRRAEPDSFVNRVLSRPTLALIGDMNGLDDRHRAG
ncbi:transcriptional regulator [Acidovorax sp. ACV01]|uniref:transcriptional regulator n=1 Tax=Acidovorax sp. ACV01 TaxID=2769311 RepID=UPI001CE0B181|nr:transcriptional regulator [Acidovorax sp. ACV01]